MSIRLFGFDGSTYTRSARLALVEKGVQHELLPAKVRDPAYASYHPWLKMPVLDHDGFRLFESMAILEYIDEAFDGPALRPADTRGRARMRQWMSAYNDYVAPKAVRSVLIPRLVLAARGMEVDDHAIVKAAKAAREALTRFDDRLGDSPYLAGEAPTLADWLLLPTVAANDELVPDESYTDGLDNLAAWYERMAARPSFAATKPT